MLRRHYSLVAIAAVLAALGGVTAARGKAGEPAQDPREQPVSLPRPVAEMRHHFVQVTRIHEAVIRGDLAAVKTPAIELVLLQAPAGSPPAAERFVEATRAAAQRAMEATDLASAAAATAVMLRQCGACHRTVVRPAPPTPVRPDVGGLVGHMLEHQRAVDELLQGLVIPSASLWSQGAERLRGEPISAGELRRDPALTESYQQADARVHEIAERAVGAQDPIARGAAYAELLTTCAECHSLHRRIWGPTSSPARGAGS